MNAKEILILDKLPCGDREHRIMGNIEASKQIVKIVEITCFTINICIIAFISSFSLRSQPVPYGFVLAPAILAMIVTPMSVRRFTQNTKSSEATTDLRANTVFTQHSSLSHRDGERDSSRECVSTGRADVVESISTE